MTSAHAFLLALTIVLCVAGVTTVVFQRLHQPVVLGYILAGLLIGPHVPFPVVADPDIVNTLSELGVILLMFGLGLEFNLRKLFRGAPTAGLTALLQCSVMISIGYVATRAIGWSTMDATFAGALVSISSTTIIAKAYDEEKIGGELREFVVGILIVEDLIAVVLMAILTGVATGSGVGARELLVIVFRLAAFLVGMIAVGVLVVPRVMRMVVKLGRHETIVVAAVGVGFGGALLADELGYSVALGAFVAGMLVAESGKGHEIEHLVEPVRDIFAAVFFVAVGMLIDPAEVASQWLAVLVCTVIVVVGKVSSVTLGAFMTGKSTTTSVSAGMSLAQIGEFSFIIAGLGRSLGVIGDYVYSVAVAVSAITTLITPALIHRADRFARYVDRKLPKPMQTFVALYGSWIEKLRTSRRESRSLLRRFARTLLLDVAAIATVLIATSLLFAKEVELLVDDIGMSPIMARLVIVSVAGVLILPFCVSVLRTTRRFSQLLGEVAVPVAGGNTLDLGRQPRLALEASVRLVGILITGSALIAITQPFLPGYIAGVVLVIAIAILAVLFWRTTADLSSHVRAAAQAVIEVLAKQTATGGAGTAPAVDPLEEARTLFPGLGAPVRYEVHADSPGVGRTLAELELRSTTGATVLAIVRDGEGFAVPDAHDPLRAGDLLAIAGTPHAIAAATVLLDGHRAP